MAHNLSTDSSGRANFAYNVERGLPWHGLGTQVEGDQDLRKMLEVSGLDREVGLVELSCFTAGDFHTLEAHRAVVMAGNASNPERVLGVVGRDYAIHQASEVFAYAEAIHEVSGAVWDTMGALGNGERFFGYLRLPEFVIDENGVADRIAQGIAVVGSHDGSLASMGFATATRVVCQNTMAAAMKNGERVFKIRHTSRSRDRLQFAQDVARGSELMVASVVAEAEALLRREDQDGTLFAATLDRFAPKADFASSKRAATLADGRREEIANLYVAGTNSAGFGRNAWSILNTFTEYLDHVAPVRITGGKDDKAVAIRRAERALMGEQDADKRAIANFLLASV